MNIDRTDDEDVFDFEELLHLRHLIQIQQQQEFEEELIAIVAFLLYGTEEARRIRAERRFQRRQYLTRSDLLPNPRTNTPWQILYEQKNDRGFVTTMNFDTATFQAILDQGFAASWARQTIVRQDVSVTGYPRNSRRSLDASGALGLILHYLSSTMHDTSLCEIFALTPATVSLTL